MSKRSMQFLPIVQRELLVASRRRATYLSRSISAGILLAFFPAVLNLQPSMAGARLLQWLSVIVFLQCLLAGVRYTCDCLSEEKREGTLGLLFLTNLSGFDVVAGKIVAHSLPAIFNLVAAIPILAISVMVGGVTGAQIVSLSIAFLVITLFSLSLGALISSRDGSERSVLVRSLIYLLILSLLPFVISDFGVRLFNSFARLFGFLNATGPVTLLSFFVDIAPVLKNLSPLHFFNEASRGFSRNFQPALWTLLTLSAAMLATHHGAFAIASENPKSANSRLSLHVASGACAWRYRNSAIIRSSGLRSVTGPARPGFSSSAFPSCFSGF